jgi:hypothetical protein
MDPGSDTEVKFMWIRIRNNDHEGVETPPVINLPGNQPKLVCKNTC